METIALIVTIVTAAVGATWVLATKLTSIEDALLAFGVRVQTVEAKVIKLEGRNRRR